MGADGVIMSAMFSHRPSQIGELKSKAMVNAAADPKSNVTAAQAEKTLMEEAEKAGSPAYMFKADATPDEKAAIAHQVRVASGGPP